MHRRGLTELREYAEMIHCSLVSSMLRSSPMVGSEMNTAVVFAVCDPYRRARWEGTSLSRWEIISCVSCACERGYGRDSR